MVWYSHLFQKFPQFIVIHTVTGFGRVHKAEVDGFLELSCLLLSCIQFFGTPWTIAHQALPSIEFSRQEYWSGQPFPSAGDLPDPGTELWSLTLQADSLPSEPLGKFNT